MLRNLGLPYCFSCFIQFIPYLPKFFIQHSQFFIIPYFVMCAIAPVVDIFTCCATPSPKFRVENAVSPSGIIHAAKSGTRFRHFKATMLAAMR